MSDNQRRVELLAPAGNYEGFLGAINAGADAVYLGGNKFGARAFADNFSTEEICRAISYAHLFQKKVYLTVNTLLKESEIKQLHEYLTPFYEAKLDGVIVQDIGVFCFIKEHFPGLELHVSTQMAITGVYGAKLLHKLGAVRIVPARELSLEEILEIKKQVPIEIETFIHGAMCYSYSGNCLFSSILGGRSGNRGRCAQPCRLPYSIEKTKIEQYPLSLKDMCTLSFIPQLIEAGIDSFKIEGRMKRPEYTAGVTAIYRKYIDLYYQNPQKTYQVAKKDFDMLQKLYIRSEIQTGYYEKHNGKDMVTLSNPGYGKAEEDLLQNIHENYLKNSKKLSIRGEITLKTNEKAKLIVFLENKKIEVYGDVVLKAIKQPLDRETILKQLQKTGESDFVFESLSIYMDNDCFLPIKALNELRRNTLETLKKELLAVHLQPPKDKELTASQENSYQGFQESKKESQLQVNVLSNAQLEVAAGFKKVSLIYLPIDLLLQDSTEKETRTLVMKASKEKDVFLALPHVMRMRSYPQFEKIRELLFKLPHKGVLFRNLEQLEWLREIGYQGEVTADTNLYCFNKKSIDFWEKYHINITLPLELNEKELLNLGVKGHTFCAYGRIPMMITANCVTKTLEGCRKHGTSFIEITDRYQKKFPVMAVCMHCYNVIYNSVPLFLAKQAAKWYQEKQVNIRLDFTTEAKEEMLSVLKYFQNCLQENAVFEENLLKEYTKGHFSRGVE